MSKNEFNILVVDDDPTHGQALREAFTRAHYNTTLVNSSEQALALAKRTEFHCLVVDCMLPRMNGVDLVEEILKLVPRQPYVFLISGIFKDRNFIKEAMERTKAVSFFTKPLLLEELLGEVNKVLPRQSEDPALLSLYTSQNLSEESAVQLIASDPTLHAFHLAKLLQRLQETTLSGELTLTSSKGSVSAIQFFHGRISAVRNPDKDSYFGSVAVSHGFVSPEEVLNALQDPSKKMLGQKLIDSLSLSPHAIQLILEEQLALRLSQTVHDDIISMQWTTKDFPKPDFTLAETRFEHLVEDWLESKFTDNWIRSTLMSWSAFLIEGEYHPRIHGPRTIEELLSDSFFNPEKDLIPLFRALIKGNAFVGARGEKTQDFSFIEARLDKMANDFKTQNFFQFLGVGEKAQPREISKAFESLKESFDPQVLPAGCPSRIIAKCNKVFVFIQKAYTTISNDAERQQYLMTLQNKREQELNETEPIFRNAIVELQEGRPREAAKIFQSLLDRKMEFKDLRAYRIWAGLKSDRNYSDLRLDQVPPEERHSAPYMMARGVYFLNKSQYKKALESFGTAHVLDPQLRIARHELRRMKADLERNKSQNRDILRDVTTFTDSLIKKSSKRSA